MTKRVWTLWILRIFQQPLEAFLVQDHDTVDFEIELSKNTPRSTSKSSASSRATSTASVLVLKTSTLSSASLSLPSSSSIYSSSSSIVSPVSSSASVSSKEGSSTSDTISYSSTVAPSPSPEAPSSLASSSLIDSSSSIPSSASLASSSSPAPITSTSTSAPATTPSPQPLKCPTNAPFYIGVDPVDPSSTRPHGRLKIGLNSEKNRYDLLTSFVPTDPGFNDATVFVQSQFPFGRLNVLGTAIFASADDNWTSSALYAADAAQLAAQPPDPASGSRDKLAWSYRDATLTPNVLYCPGPGSTQSQLWQCDTEIFVANPPRDKFCFEIRFTIECDERIIALPIA
ncbi:hypothetical protein NX059_010546 [Plenodomus lindquistii]|nr:hypothetical protein NX059_010546 [Plenodomus lindquistii]